MTKTVCIKLTTCCGGKEEGGEHLSWKKLENGGGMLPHGVKWMKSGPQGDQWSGGQLII